jgi:hypothetical protein
MKEGFVIESSFQLILGARARASASDKNLNVQSIVLRIKLMEIRAKELKSWKRTGGQAVK